MNISKKLEIGDWVTCDFNYDLCAALTPNKPYKVIGTMIEDGDFMMNIIANDGTSRWYSPQYSPTLDAKWTICKPPHSHFPFILVIGAFAIGLVYFNWVAK
jgi:hypothetical protein